MSEHESRNPTSCRETGLNCEACTSQTAAELARACRGLRGKAVAQLFVQLYPEPGCSRMHAQFAAAYRAASRADECGDDWEDIPTPSTSTSPASPRVLVAVA